MEKISDFFSGLAMTILGGAFLAASFALMLAGVSVFPNPAWGTVVICGLPIAHSAFYNLAVQKRISSPLLIVTAMLAAIFIGEVFAAAEVAFIMALGEMLEDYTAERAKRGIKKLINLMPLVGRVIEGEKEKKVEISRIKAGDILRVLAGESVPVDALIVSGNASIDQSIITGESIPADKSAGDEVFCGTINRFGAIDIRATKVGKDSSLEKLIRLVRDAEEKKSPFERIADKWAGRLVPAALFLALLTYILTGDVSRAVTILVVFCPCALVLATPTAVMAAIGQAAKNGVIIKSGEALERMGKVDCVAFDKTGTLTRGEVDVSAVLSFDGEFSKEDILELSASVEAFSEHPLGRACTMRAARQGLKLSAAENFKMVVGMGVLATVKGAQVLCGNIGFMRANNIAVSATIMSKLDAESAEGRALILVACNGRLVGAVSFSDTMRQSAPEVVKALAKLNVQSVLLTGDNLKTAAYFASLIGIKNFHANLLPSQKLEKLEILERDGMKVCMVGDGVNDAPALKRAYVGIAPAKIGSDIAVDAADIALMGDDISKIPYLKRLSNATVWWIKFNISLSMLINVAAIILSVMGLLNPITGALVHNVGSVLVVLNAGLLYDRNFADKK